LDLNLFRHSYNELEKFNIEAFLDSQATPSEPRAVNGAETRVSMNQINPQPERLERDLESSIGRGDKLEIRLWLRLLTCSTMIERQVRARMRARFDITLPRFDVLAQIYRSPNGLSMGELSSLLMVSNGNVTVLIDRLVQDGLVTREPAGHDRRSLWVRMTPSGRAAFEAMTVEHEQWLEELLAGFAREEKQRLFGMLGKFKQALKRDAGEESGAAAAE
jgi:DNA-binding MarR family transcriptional regulator